jgi:hypothetical protein
MDKNIAEINFLTKYPYFYSAYVDAYIITMPFPETCYNGNSEPY